MATKMQEQVLADKLAVNQLQTLIGDEVMRQLGQPDDLHRVQVRRLWDERYRVNVFVGDNPLLAVLAHSYFIVSDQEGNIVLATPKITRHYELTPSKDPL
jgi:hypothetical protein